MTQVSGDNLTDFRIYSITVVVFKYVLFSVHTSPQHFSQSAYYPGEVYYLKMAHPFYSAPNMEVNWRCLRGTNLLEVVEYLLLTGRQWSVTLSFWVYWLWRIEWSPRLGLSLSSCEAPTSAPSWWQVCETKVLVCTTGPLSSVYCPCMTIYICTTQPHSVIADSKLKQFCQLLLHINRWKQTR